MGEKMRFIFKSNLKNRKKNLNTDVENCGSFKGFGFTIIIIIIIIIIMYGQSLTTNLIVT